MSFDVATYQVYATTILSFVIENHTLLLQIYHI